MSFDLNYVVNNGNYTNENGAGNDISNIFPPTEVQTIIFSFNGITGYIGLWSAPLKINTTDYAVFPTIYSIDQYGTAETISNDILNITIQKDSGSFKCNILLGTTGTGFQLTVVCLVVYNVTNLGLPYNQIT
jgi:hypothetical protein